jgi:hypothetical protein
VIVNHFSSASLANVTSVPSGKFDEGSFLRSVIGGLLFPATATYLLGFPIPIPFPFAWLHFLKLRWLIITEPARVPLQFAYEVIPKVTDILWIKDLFLFPFALQRRTST